MDLAEEVGAAPLWPGMIFAEEAAGDGARLRLWKEEVSEHVEYRLPVIELASEKEMGLGFASNGTPMWLLFPEVAEGRAAPGSEKCRQFVCRQRKYLNGKRLPLAAADRSMATRSVIPYLPSKYRIIVKSSMLLWLELSILPDFNQEP